MHGSVSGCSKGSEGGSVGSGDIKVGVLPLSGTMAISEVTMKNSTQLAIDEINPAIFAQKASKLIENDGVVTVFGGWTSASRKAMLPMSEKTQNLLWYPVQFEGNECSPNIMYSGAQSTNRPWARRGTRPSAPKGQRTKSVYIFGTICPKQGKGAGLVLPFCNTETMSMQLAEIALAVGPGAHALVLMDQAGWHMTGKFEVPANISIVALPAKCPELNPVENIWQFMRDNLLSNRVFASYDNIVNHCCEA